MNNSMVQLKPQGPKKNNKKKQKIQHLSNLLANTS